MKYSLIALVVVLVLVGLFSALGPTEFSKSSTTSSKTEAQSFLADTEKEDDSSAALNAKIDLADVKDADNDNAYEENLA